MRLGYNVLYITMEMGEDEILHRIDANILDTSMSNIAALGKNKFMKKIDFHRQKNYGEIKVIQFPTSSAHAGHFKNVLNELNLKLNWKPDIMMVDYIGIVASSRLKVGSTNSHFYLKSVAEELRAIAIEYDIAVWSAMQLTRSGMGSSDIEMTDIAESIGIPSVCDFMLAGMRNEELDRLGQIFWKQLKNRFRQMQYKPKFITGCDFEKQILRDVDQPNQHLIEDIPNTEDMFNSKKIQEKFEKRYNKSKPFSKVDDIDMGEF
jgi:hypothetical protein